MNETEEQGITVFWGSTYDPEKIVTAKEGKPPKSVVGNHSSSVSGSYKRDWRTGPLCLGGGNFGDQLAGWPLRIV